MVTLTTHSGTTDHTMFLEETRQISRIRARYELD